MTISKPSLNHTVQRLPKAVRVACGRVSSGLRSLPAMGAAAVLGIVGGTGLTGIALPSAPAQAQTAPLSQSLRRLPQESFEQFVQRAESTADTTVDRYFSLNPQANQVDLTIIGASEGLQAPVLSVDVTRSEWQGRSGLANQTTYFPSTRVLLGFADPALEGDDAAMPDATADSDSGTPEAVTSETVIQTPSNDSLTGGRSIDTDDSTESGPIQPETSFTTPLEQVAPLDFDPDAGVTGSGNNFDFEDTNDFEFLPDEDDPNPFDVDPASEAPDSDAIDVEGNPEVIEEPAGL
ncbi:MAG: hypothetical protein ACFB8W_05140 [Elainellaceae cyanobacterium]